MSTVQLSVWSLKNICPRITDIVHLIFKQYLLKGSLFLFTIMKIVFSANNCWSSVHGALEPGNCGRLCEWNEPRAPYLWVSKDVQWGVVRLLPQIHHHATSKRRRLKEAGTICSQDGRDRRTRSP